MFHTLPVPNEVQFLDEKRRTQMFLELLEVGLDVAYPPIVSCR